MAERNSAVASQMYYATISFLFHCYGTASRHTTCTVCWFKSSTPMANHILFSSPLLWPGVSYIWHFSFCLFHIMYVTIQRTYATAKWLTNNCPWNMTVALIFSIGTKWYAHPHWKSLFQNHQVKFISKKTSGLHLSKLTALFKWMIRMHGSTAIDTHMTQSHRLEYCCMKQKTLNERNISKKQSHQNRSRTYMHFASFIHTIIPS